MTQNKGGYKALAASVLLTAYNDVNNKDAQKKWNARIFFEKKWYNLWADVLDLSHEAIEKKYREILKEEGGNHGRES